MSRMLLGASQREVSTAVLDWFIRDHYTVRVEDSAMRILQALRENEFDVIVLGMLHSEPDSIEVVRACRAAGVCTPILLVSSKHDPQELRSALDAGADAFLIAPVSLPDLAAQVRALLRRPSLRAGKVLRLGEIEIDTGNGTVTRNDVVIHLLPMEFKLLYFLFSHPNQVFSARAIFERVWQKDGVTMDGTVRTHVRTLRQKLDVAGKPSVITTVRGLGYKAEISTMSTINAKKVDSQ